MVLFVVVGIAALGAAAVTVRNIWLSGSFITLGTALMLWSIVEWKKPFWRAFCVFSFGILVLLETSLFEKLRNSYPATNLAYSIVNRDAITTGQFGNRIGTPNAASPEGQLRSASLRSFTLAVAMLFGVGAGAVYHWRTERENRRGKKDVSGTVNG